MLPHVMAFNTTVRADKYALVAKEFGVHSPAASDEANAAAAIDAVSKLSIAVGTARSIEQLGGNRETIALAVQQAITDPCMLSTARPASAGDVEAMYLAALADPALYPVEAALATASARL
jgi:alcohol dehydrogenase